MSATVVGSAYVVIRAVTTKLASDIKDGIDKGAKDADVDSSGEDLGSRLSESVKKGLDKGGIGDSLSTSLETAGREAGERASTSISDGLDNGGVETTAGDIGKTSGERLAEGMRRAARAQLANDGPSDWIDFDLTKPGGKSGTSLTEGMRRAALSQLAANGPADWIEATSRDGDSKIDNIFRRMFRGLSGSFSSSGNDSGGSFADGFSKGFKGKNPLGKMLDAIRIPPIAALALLAVPAIGGALKIVGAYVIGLVAQVGYLATAVGGLGAAAAAAGVGLAAGIGPLLAAFKTNTPALENFKKSLEGVGKEWKKVGAATQLTLLPGLERALKTTTALVPAFSKFGTEIGGIAGNTAELVAGILTSESGQRSLNAILMGSVGIWTQLQRVAVNVVNAILPFLEAAQPIAQRFATSIGNITQKMAEVATAGQKSGSLTATLTEWYDRGELVMKGLGNIGVALWNTLKIGADVAQPFFDTFGGFAEKWRTFTESASGKSRIAEIFENALPVMTEVNKLVRDIAIAIFEPVASGDNGAIIGFLQTLRVDLLPALQELGTSLSANAGPALQSFFTTLIDLITKLSDSGALGSFLGTLTPALATFIAILDTPVFRSVIPPLLTLLGTFKALNTISFGGFSKALSGVVSGLGTLTGATGAFKAIGPAMVTAFAQAGGGFAGLGAAATAAAGGIWAAVSPLLPFIAAAAAVVAAIVAIVWAFKNWDKIKEWVSKAWEVVTTFVSELPGKVSGAATALWEWIQNAIPLALAKLGAFGIAVGTWLGELPGKIWTWIQGAAKALWSWLEEAIPVVLEKLGQFFAAIGNGLLALPGKIGGWLLGAAKALGNFLLDAIPWVVQNVPKFILSLYKFLYVELPLKIITWLAKAAVALFKWVIDAIPGLVSALGRFVGSILKFLVSLPGKILGWIGGAAKALWSWVLDAIPKLVYGLGYLIGTILRFLVDLPGKIAGWLAGAVTALFKWVVDAIPGLVVALGQFIGQVLRFLLDLPLKIVTWLGAAVIALVSWVITAIPGLLVNLGQFLGQLASWIIGLPLKIVGWIVAAIPAIVNWVRDAIPWLLAHLASFLGSVMSWVLALPGKIIGWIAAAVPAMIGWAADAVSQIPGKLAEFAGKVWDWATTFVSELPGKFGDVVGALMSVGEDVVTGIWEGIKGMAGWLGDQLSGFVGGIIDGFTGKKGIDSGSPSRLTARMVGVPIVQGIAAGMNSASGRYLDPAIQQAVDTITSGFDRNPIGVSFVPDVAAMSSLKGMADFTTAATVNSGSVAVSLQVKIGDQDITDIVDVKLTDYQSSYARKLYSRGVQS